MRVKRYRARLKPSPNGGGPGGKRQLTLLPRSEMRQRKPSKSAVKPKQDALFPADVNAWFAALSVEQQKEVRRIVAEHRGEGAASDNGQGATADIM